MQEKPYREGGSNENSAAAPLPVPTHPIRWVKSRKRAILEAIHGGMLTTEEAHDHYGISEQELGLWQHQFESEGEGGLSSGALMRNHIHNLRRRAKETR